jgi:hypothetical protein
MVVNSGLSDLAKLGISRFNPRAWRHSGLSHAVMDSRIPGLLRCRYNRLEGRTTADHHYRWKKRIEAGGTESLKISGIQKSEFWKSEKTVELCKSNAWKRIQLLQPVQQLVKQQGKASGNKKKAIS